MNRIVEKRQLSENVFGMTIEAPLIASERKAGQFIILMVDEEAGERIPLTIADADEKAAGNRVTIIMGARNKSLFVMLDEMRASLF